MNNLQLLSDHEAACLKGGFFDTFVSVDVFSSDFQVVDQLASTFLSQNATSAGILGFASSANGSSQLITQFGSNQG